MSLKPEILMTPIAVFWERPVEQAIIGRSSKTSNISRPFYKLEPAVLSLLN